MNIHNPENTEFTADFNQATVQSLQINSPIISDQVDFLEMKHIQNESLNSKHEQKTGSSYFKNKIKSQRIESDYDQQQNEYNEKQFKKHLGFKNRVKKYRSTHKTNQIKQSPTKNRYNITIHQLLRDREQIQEILLKATNRYRFAELKKQKLLKSLTYKKQKCQKINKIRQSYLETKKKLTSSRIEMKDEILVSNKHSKQVVSEEKKNLKKSILNCLDNKKNTGYLIRTKKQQDKLLIDKQRMRQFNRKKGLHTQIIEQHEHQKKTREEILQIKKRMATQHYIDRIKQEVLKNNKLYKKQNRVLPKVYNKIRQLNNESAQYDEEVADCQKFLREI